MRLGVTVVLSLSVLMGVTATVATPPTRADSQFQLQVPVLMYHRILCPTATTTSPGLFVCPDLLERQMALLESQGWHSITADELVDDLGARQCPPDKTFVIMVDDGALDGYTNGAPIWEDHGFRATFAMVVGKVGDYLTNPDVNKPHFSWDQARDLVARGHGIANHTMWHTSVSSMNTFQLNAAVQDAETVLQQELGFAPKTFVYPYGAVGSAPTYLSSRFGLAFTTKHGAFEATTDPMVSPRIRVTGRETPAQVLSSMKPFANPCANTTPAPRIVAKPTSANFGNVATGSTSSAIAFVVTNKGSADLTIGATSLTGADRPEFSIVSNRCSGKTLLPGFTCKVSVTFGPTHTGPASAALQISSNDPVRPTLNVSLSGTGVTPGS